MLCKIEYDPYGVEYTHIPSDIKYKVSHRNWPGTGRMCYLEISLGDALRRWIKLLFVSRSRYIKQKEQLNLQLQGK